MVGGGQDASVDAPRPRDGRMRASDAAGRGADPSIDGSLMPDGEAPRIPDAGTIDAGGSSDAGPAVDGGPRADAGEPGWPETDRPLGGPCSGSGMCMSTDRCFHGWDTTVLPEGLCSRACQQDADCGPDGACVWSRGEQGLCAPRCDAARHCRPGYECRSETALGGGTTEVCVPPPDDEPTEFPIGAPCEADHECGQGKCLTGSPNGYCTRECDPSGSPSACGDDACVAIRVRLAMGTGIVGLCGVPCRDASDCRPGYACDTWENATTNDTYCVGP
jgi:hypothetical protein